MSTWLGPVWPNLIHRKPPRMSTEDYEIWLRWYPRYLQTTKALYFDVGIGPGAPAPETDPNSPYLRAWTRNTQRRLDAILVREDELWIVELRFLASPSAVGRLLIYRALWEKEPPLPGPTKLYLVTNHRDADLTLLTQRYNIIYEVA